MSTFFLLLLLSSGAREPATETAKAVDGPAGDSGDSVFDIFEEQRAAVLDINAAVVTGGGASGADTRAAAPANLTVITAEEISRFGWRSLAQILSTVPGLYVIDDLVQPSISVRGVSGGPLAGTRLVKIMINGVQVNFRPELSAFIGPEFLPMEVIERVEIAKGPLSALYGANAFLATVNVVTKTPEKGVHSEVAGRGTWQQSSPHAGYGGSGIVSYGSDLFDFMATTSADQTDRSGVKVQQTFAAQLNNVDPLKFGPFFNGKSQNDVSRPTSTWLMLDFKPAALGTLALQGGLQGLDSSGEFQLNSVLSHKDEIALYNLWSSLSHQKNWTSFLSSNLSLGWSQGGPQPDYHLVLNQEGQNNDIYNHVPQYAYGAFDVAANLAFNFDNYEFKLGGDFENDRETVLWYKSIALSPLTVTPPDVPATPDRVMQNGGVYAAASAAPIRALSGLRFTANFRLDHLTYGPVVEPWQYSWRAAVSYRQSENFVAKIFAGRSFQGPSGVLMFAQPGEFAFGANNGIIGQYVYSQTTLTPGKILLPQVVQSVEASVIGQAWKILSFDVGGFFQQIDNTISFGQINGNLLAQNGASTSFVGAEASLRVAVNRLSARFSGSYESELASNDPDNPTPAAMPLFPSFQFFAIANLALPEAFLQVSALGRVIGQRGASNVNVIQNGGNFYTLPPYGDIDVAVSTRGLHLFRTLGETTVTLAGRNLIGLPHSEPGYGGFDLPTIGRNFYLELRQSF